MNTSNRWLLPDGIEEVLPPQAEHVEAVRRRLLDQFALAGFELVVTPMLEYLESLLTGTGSDLDLKTFKVTDQVTGRTMGVRADITPQVARIDAHSLGRDGVTRLCYAGTVLHAIADNQLASRSPISVGAELFGDTGRAGDLEIVSLLIDCIRAEDIPAVHLELGDVGIFRDLMNETDLDSASRENLFALIQRKASAELAAAVGESTVSGRTAEQIKALPSLCGGADVLDRARAAFAGNEAVLARIDHLGAVADGLRARFPALDVYFDLAELRGYAYHTGIVFAAYKEGTAIRLAKGGRYDDVGAVFGRARAATGFDIDLKALAAASRKVVAPARRVSAPHGEAAHEAARWASIQSLRQQGYVVVEGEDPDADHVLVLQDNEWKLVEQKS